MPLRRALAVLTMLVVALLAGPATATATPTETPAPAPSPTPTEAATPSPAPTDGIREVPAPDEGADLYSILTILLFFVIAMGLLVLIIRSGMRSTDRED